MRARELMRARTEKSVLLTPAISVVRGWGAHYGDSSSEFSSKWFCIHLAVSGRHDISSGKKAFFVARRLHVPVRPHTGSVGVLDRRWAAGQGTYS